MDEYLTNLRGNNQFHILGLSYYQGLFVDDDGAWLQALFKNSDLLVY